MFCMVLRTGRCTVDVRRKYIRSTYMPAIVLRNLCKFDLAAQHLGHFPRRLLFQDHCSLLSRSRASQQRKCYGKHEKCNKKHKKSSRTYGRETIHCRVCFGAIKSAAAGPRRRDRLGRDECIERVTCFRSTLYSLFSTPIVTATQSRHHNSGYACLPA